MPMVSLQTDPPILRRFRESELVEYAERCADPRIMRCLGMGKTPSRVETWLEGISEHTTIPGVERLIRDIRWEPPRNLVKMQGKALKSKMMEPEPSDNSERE